MAHSFIESRTSNQSWCFHIRRTQNTTMLSLKEDGQKGQPKTVFVISLIAIDIV